MAEAKVMPRFPHFQFGAKIGFWLRLAVLVAAVAFILPVLAVPAEAAEAPSGRPPFCGRSIQAPPPAEQRHSATHLSAEIVFGPDHERV